MDLKEGLEQESEDLKNDLEKGWEKGLLIDLGKDRGKGLVIDLDNGLEKCIGGRHGKRLGNWKKMNKRNLL